MSPWDWSWTGRWGADAVVPPSPPPACTPGGGTSYSDAVEWDAEAAWNLGPGDHWFRADFSGGQPYWYLSSGGQPFFAEHPDAAWAAWAGDGVSAPADVSGDFGLTTEGTDSRVGSGNSSYGPALYLVVTVPSGCRPLALGYGETVPP